MWKWQEVQEMLPQLASIRRTGSGPTAVLFRLGVLWCLACAFGCGSSDRARTYRILDDRGACTTYVGYESRPESADGTVVLLDGSGAVLAVAKEESVAVRGDYGMAGALLGLGAAVIVMAAHTTDDEPAVGILFAAPVGATLATVSGTVLGGMIPRWKPLDAYEEVEK